MNGISKIECCFGPKIHKYNRNIQIIETSMCLFKRYFVNEQEDEALNSIRLDALR